MFLLKVTKGAHKNVNKMELVSSTVKNFCTGQPYPNITAALLLPLYPREDKILVTGAYIDH